MIHILVIDNDTDSGNSIVDLIESANLGVYKITRADFSDFEIKIADADIVISDYKNDAGDNDAGLNVFKKIRDSKFAPIIIYSGFITSIHSDIASHTSSFLRIVEKRAGSDTTLLTHLSEIVGSKEFKVKQEVEKTLSESINKNFREYFWEIIQENWDDFRDISEEILTRILSRKIIKDLYPLLIEEDSIHAIEFYEHPLSSKSKIETGTIIKKEENFFVCITNDCDLEVRNGSCKATKLNLLPVKTIPTDWYGTPLQNAAMFNNNGSKREQKFFLPKTFFFSGGYIEFEDMLTKGIFVVDGKIVLTEIGEPITKIHPPFIHRLIANFVRHHNRFGTPNINT